MECYIFWRNIIFFSINQHGFLLGLGSEDSLYNYPTQYSSTIFLDVSKSFGSVNHSTLIEKLFRYGFKGKLLNWFRSYLLNRTKVVKIQNVRSYTRMVFWKISKGNILKPALFLIYINAGNL